MLSLMCVIYEKHAVRSLLHDAMLQSIAEVLSGERCRDATMIVHFVINATAAAAAAYQRRCSRFELATKSHLARALRAYAACGAFANFADAPSDIYMSTYDIKLHFSFVIFLPRENCGGCM